MVGEYGGIFQFLQAYTWMLKFFAKTDYLLTRKRHADTDRQTDSDRLTDRHTDGQTDIQTDRKTEISLFQRGKYITRMGPYFKMATMKKVIGKVSYKWNRFLFENSTCGYLLVPRQSRLF